MDPDGAFADTMRNAYASWMRVPEYPDPIRVRWYKIDRPEPGSYPLTDYSSSNWDDFQDYDPELGEQSTTRDPRADWRNGSPPPWPFDPICGTPPFPLRMRFTIPASNTYDVCEERAGVYDADWIPADGNWQAGPFQLPSYPGEDCYLNLFTGFTGSWDLEFTGPGGFTTAWTKDQDWDYLAPLTLDLFVDEFGCSSEADQVTAEALFP